MCVCVFVAVWTNRSSAAPVALAAVPSARRVALVDDRLCLSAFWVTPDAGTRPSPDGTASFFWGCAIRRELRDRPGFLSKAMKPFLEKGKLRSDGKYRYDLALKLGGFRFKLSRLLCDWKDQNGDPIPEEFMEDMEVDHREEGENPTRPPPRNYNEDNLRPLDKGTHRQLQPARGRKRPAASQARQV